MMAGNQSPRLSFESLESKQLLAGDVTVSLIGGTLRIVGDDAANQIAVTAGDAAGEFVIQGLEGTVVHLAGSEDPAPEAGLEVAGVRNMQVRLGDGADELSLSGAELRGSLAIDAGAGDDEVTLSDVSVRGVLHIAAGAGNDTVTLGVADEPETPAAAVARGLGNGGLSNGGFNNIEASVKAGGAIDVVLGEGDDALTANSVAARGAIVVGGGVGADDVDLSDVHAAALVVRGGDGDAADSVSIADARAIAALIGTGGGDDEVSIVDAAFTSLNVALGDGDDSFSLGNTRARVAVLAGGAGASDELDDAGDNELGRRVVTGFEVPDDANTSTRPFGPFGGHLAHLLARLRR